MTWLFVTLVLTATAPADALAVREIEIVNFSHTDVGFTDHPIVCRELYRRYVDIALDAVRGSSGRPRGEQFVWTAESALAVRDWWEAASPERRGLFLEAVRSGQLEVTTLACNNTPFMNAAQWQTMVHWLREEVWNAGRVQVGIRDDFNGFPRAGAKALLDCGIHRLFTGINEDSGGPPFRRPSAFWWKQPDGRRLFVWLNQGYGSGVQLFRAGRVAPRARPPGLGYALSPTPRRRLPPQR